MILASYRDYGTMKKTNINISSFEEFKRTALEILPHFQNDDFRPGIALAHNELYVPNLSVGITEVGYALIVNRGLEYDFDQHRLNNPAGQKGSPDNFLIRWDEIEDIPSNWLVPEAIAAQAIDFWIKHEDMDPSLEWIGTG